jgi:hypothetical protein
MKKSIKNPVKIGALLASLLLVCGTSSGTVYTAVASGNWSASATWGGTAPTFTLVTDQVIIPLTFTVTMDQNVTLNGATASVDVLGTLSAASYISLDVTSGTLSGAGSITSASKVILGAAGSLTFSGILTADSIISSVTSLATTAQITFYNELNLAGMLTINTLGSLTAGANSNITISGGSVVLAGGLLGLTSNYSVNYITASTLAGMELSGTGLGPVTINVPSADSVVLSADAALTDSLKFVTGMLKLNGFNLITSSQITGAVAIMGNTLSSVTINTTTGLSNAISFVTGFQELNNLTINVGTGNSVAISSPLTVNGILSIVGTSALNISGAAITVIGNLTGTGTMDVNTLTKLAFTGISSITGDLSLSGINVGKFTENLGSGKTLNMATALNVDTLDLMSGTLVLNGNNLSVNADVTAAGTGLILSTSRSSINVTTSDAVTGPLMFTASGDSINNMTVTIGNAGSVTLGTNLIIKGTLDFVTGYVNVDTNNLLIDINGAITGATNTAYVITSYGGYLTMFDSIGKSIIYQVGSLTSYLPATLNLNSGSVTGTVGVSVSPDVYSHGTTGVLISASQPMVNATWLFQNNIGAGINANMTLSYPTLAEVNGFVNTDYAYISHYASMWDNIGDSMIAVVAGGLNSLTRANVTSMSPFAVFDQSTIPTSINEVAKSNGGIAIYPNPTSQSLYIQNTTGVAGVVYVEIYNTIGQLVSKSQFNDSQTAIPVSGLADGMYLIRSYNDNMDVVKKFSKM